jgi:Holliday junction resolvase RusA-like endonuclease
MAIEFTILGPPLSHQTRDRQRLDQWKQAVRAAAEGVLPAGHLLLGGPLQMTVVYYHDGATVRLDNDNMVKPIQDSLNGVVFVDDRQITHTNVRKQNLNGRFVIRNMSPVLAAAFCHGEEFLYIRVDDAPDDGRLL